MKNVISKLASIFLFCLTVATACGDDFTWVTVSGMASKESANFRELALSDALRNAVQQGAGVNLISETKVTDFQLDYDRVFSAAFGYVKTYSVLSRKMGEDGLFRVEIKAQVGKGTPRQRDWLAIQQMARMKEMPRIAIEVRELIKGLPEETHLTENWFKQKLSNLGLPVMDVRNVASQENKDINRDRFLGMTNSAIFREQGIDNKFDFIIQAVVFGNPLPANPIDKSLRYEYQIRLDAFVPDTRFNIASVTLPPFDKGVSEATTPSVAAGEILYDLLDGNYAKLANFGGGPQFFETIFARWIAEKDLGRMIEVEFYQVDMPELGRIVSDLGSKDKVYAVYVREFMRLGISKIAVITDWKTFDLGAAIQKLVATQTLEGATVNAIRFQKTQTPVQPTNNVAPQPVPAPTAGSPILWLAIGAGVILIAASLFFMGRRSGTPK